MSAGTCRGRTCRAECDSRGDHRASCSRSGLLQLRAKPLERTWARIMREAGARVQERFMLRDSGIAGIRLSDKRQIEVVATGLSFLGGVPLAIDCTLVSPLDAKGRPHPGVVACVGEAADEAAKVNRRTYKELVNSRDLRLVVAASETGGRLHEEGEKLLWSAAAHRAQSEPVRLRKAACRAFYARWCTLLSVAVQSALAATLVEEGVGLLDGVGGGAPPLAAVVCGEVGDFDFCEGGDAVGLDGAVQELLADWPAEDALGNGALAAA